MGFLFADRIHGAAEVLAKTADIGAEAVIPSKPNRLFKREYDRYIYKQRRMAENAFERIKRRRGLAARYCKGPSPLSLRFRSAASWLWLLASRDDRI